MKLNSAKIRYGGNNIDNYYYACAVCGRIKHYVTRPDFFLIDKEDNIRHAMTGNFSLAAKKEVPRQL